MKISRNFWCFRIANGVKVNPKLIVTVTLICTIYYLFSYDISQKWISSHEYINYDLFAEEFIDSNQTCHLPRYHPFHPSILNFILNVKPRKCRDISRPLTFIDDSGVLRFNKTYLGGVSAWVPISCEYREILRDNTDFVDTYKFNVSKSFNGAANVSHADFIQVNCNYFSIFETYYNIHAHIRSSNLDSAKSPSEKVDISQTYNVLLFGIDSLSRLNAMRQIPKTYKFLKNMPNNYILRGYTKVGRNTFPNLVSLLTGYHPYEKPSVFDPPDTESKPHDTWPLMWKNFSKFGYRTLYAEDHPEQSTFHLYNGGFDAQPTDHYMRTYWKAVDQSYLHKFSSYLCFGSKSKLSHHLDYIKNFVTSLYEKIPFWGISFITEICHDYLNTIGGSDEELYSFVKMLNDGKFLEKTFFIFFSDHGQRIDAIRESYVGSIEDRMPLMIIHIPEKLKSVQPMAIQNFYKNEFRLTTAFDMYCTIMDVLKLSVDENHQLGNIKTKHGMSLFGSIPADRNCESAGVESAYCVCRTEIEVPVKELYIQSAAKHLVANINFKIISKFKDFKKCAELSLNQVKYAHSTSVATNKTVKVVFQTLPGNGLFEGMVFISKTPDNEFTFGEVNIERINRYGDQSVCITDNLLRPFCYCH